MYRGWRKGFIKIFVFCQLLIFSKPMFSVGVGGSLGYAFSGSLSKGEVGKNNVSVNSLDMRGTFSWSYIDLTTGLRLDIGKSRITVFSEIANGTNAPSSTTTPNAQISGKFNTYNESFNIQYLTFEILGKIPIIAGMTANTKLYPLFGIALDIPIFGIDPSVYAISLDQKDIKKLDANYMKDNYGEYYLRLLEHHLAIWGELGLGLDIYMNEKVALRPQILCGISHAIIPNKRDLGISYKIDLRLGFSYYKR